jgi:hypothetical protein
VYEVAVDAGFVFEFGVEGDAVSFLRTRNYPMPTYKRKDGKVLVWDDPRLDAPYWQECGDYIC